MIPGSEGKLERRVVQAAEAALARNQVVSAIDVLSGIGWLNPVHVRDWRRGRVDSLERVVGANLKRISLAMSLFRRWAVERGLKPSETRYVRRTRSGVVDLRFSLSGTASIESSFRTCYISPALSERKREKLEAELGGPGETVVFSVLRDSRCAECGREFRRGDFLTHEQEKGLCMKCAGLADLVYLPRGDNALTRRASKHTQRRAVVVRFSRARKRYERRGLLVEAAALARARDELCRDLPDCASDPFVD